MAPHIPGPRRARPSLDDVEGEVARTAGLVLHLTALAERYARHAGSAQRVELMLAAADLGRRSLVELADEPAAAGWP